MNNDLSLCKSTLERATDKQLDNGSPSSVLAEKQFVDTH